MRHGKIVGNTLFIAKEPLIKSMIGIRTTETTNYVVAKLGNIPDIPCVSRLVFGRLRASTARPGINQWFLKELKLTSVVLFLCFSSSVSSEALKEGVWKGTYSVSQYQAQYHVTNIGDGEKAKSNIKMVLPEFEPRTDFTYELKDVLISDTGLSFTIHKKNEIQKCKLKKNDTEQYLGTCQSDADKDGSMLVEISMMPPQITTDEQESSSTETNSEKNK